MFNTKWSTWPFAPPNTKWWRRQCHHNTSTIVEKFSPLFTRGDVGSLTPFPATKWWQTLNLLNVLNKQDFKFSKIAQILHFGQQNWEWRRFYHSTLKKTLICLLKYKLTSDVLWTPTTILAWIRQITQKRAIFRPNSWSYPNPMLFKTGGAKVLCRFVLACYEMEMLFMTPICLKVTLYDGDTSHDFILCRFSICTSL